MEPPFHNSLIPSTFLDLNEEQPQQDHLFNLNTHISLSPLIINNNTPLDHGDYFYKDPQRFQPLQDQDGHKIFSSGGSCDDHNYQRINMADQSDQSENSDDLIKLTIWKNNNNDHKSHMIMSTKDENFDDSTKWTSSKMRMMRKMIITNHDDHKKINSSNDHHHQHKSINFTTHKLSDHQTAMIKKNTPFAAHDHSNSSSSNNNGIIRVCTDCNTTKTPLWRSGPRGPKSLCNACGIRQRKARRAMAAAAAAANGTIVAVEDSAAAKKTNIYKVKNKKENKTKVNNNSTTVNCVNPQFKKRSNNNNNNKITSASSRGRKKKMLCFEDLIRISMSKSSDFQRVFPQDERDAAILLMALSYGLVHG